MAGGDSGERSAEVRRARIKPSFFSCTLCFEGWRSVIANILSLPQSTTLSSLSLVRSSGLRPQCWPRHAAFKFQVFVGGVIHDQVLPSVNMLHIPAWALLPVGLSRKRVMHLGALTRFRPGVRKRKSNGKTSRVRKGHRCRPVVVSSSRR